MSEWKNIPKDITPYVGFVYTILEKDTQIGYIGIKKFWKTIKRKPLKGKKNKRHETVESDWKTYNSSSSILQEKIKNNPDNYEKEIIRCCKSITEMKCYEAHAQLSFYVRGSWDLLYNEVVNLRVRIRKNE